jgi:hypothetical protein
MLISTKFSILSRISGCLSQYLYQRLIPPLFLVQLSLLRLHYSLTHQPLHLSQRLQFFQLHLSLRRALESRYQPLDQMFIQQCVPLMSCLTPYHTRPHLNSKSLRDQRRPSQNLRSQPIRRSTFFPFPGPSLSHTFTKPPTSVYITQMEREVRVCCAESPI